MVILCLLSFQTSSAMSYRWPLQNEKSISSTFAEFRAGHFHSGIDIRTGGREGLPVYAVEDGSISRINISSWGYGKSLYLQLADQKTIVYAHLQGFTDRIQNRIDFEQQKEKRYRINFYLEPHEFPVKKGQLLAYSGATGIGPPHLHFEMRDAYQHPLNPLVNGFSLFDQTPPIPKRVAVKPLNQGSRVGGLPETKIYELKLESGEYRSSEPIHFSGEIGLALESYDQAEKGGNHFATYATEVSLNSKIIFSSEYKKFSYANTNQINLDRDFSLYNSGVGIFQNLYVIPGNRLEFYQKLSSGLGTISDSALESGMHKLKILLKDARGNQSTINLNLTTPPFPLLESLSVTSKDTLFILRTRVKNNSAFLKSVVYEYSSSGSESWQRIGMISKSLTDSFFTLSWPAMGREKKCFRSFGLLENGGRSPALYACSPGNSSTEEGSQLEDFSYQINSSPQGLLFEIQNNIFFHNPPDVFLNKKNLPLSQRSLKTFNGYYTPIWLSDDPLFHLEIEMVSQTTGTDTLRDTLHLSRITPQVGVGLSSRDGLAKAVFVENNVVQECIGFIKTIPLPPVTSGLIPQSAGYQFFPQDVPFDKSVDIFLKPSLSDPARMGIYEYKEKQWVWLGSDFDKNLGFFSAKVYRFSTFALLQDTIPPLLSNFSPQENARIKDLQPRLSFSVDDLQSGISSDLYIQVHLNGQPLIYEYDPELKLAFYKSRRKFQKGEYRVKIAVNDNAGNLTEISYPFWIQ